jgi:hypothetical protein
MVTSVRRRRSWVTVDLREACADGHVALGLGAGVSQGSGLPSWNEPVCRRAEALPDIGRKSAQTLLDAGYDATVLVTVLRRKVARKPFKRVGRPAERAFPVAQVGGCSLPLLALRVGADAELTQAPKLT